MKIQSPFKLKHFRSKQLILFAVIALSLCMETQSAYADNITLYKNGKSIRIIADRSGVWAGQKRFRSFSSAVNYYLSQGYSKTKGAQKKPVASSPAVKNEKKPSIVTGAITSKNYLANSWKTWTSITHKTFDIQIEAVQAAKEEAEKEAKYAAIEVGIVEGGAVALGVPSKITGLAFSSGEMFGVLDDVDKAFAVKDYALAASIISKEISFTTLTAIGTAKGAVIGGTKGAVVGAAVGGPAGAVQGAKAGASTGAAIGAIGTAAAVGALAGYAGSITDGFADHFSGGN